MNEVVLFWCAGLCFFGLAALAMILFTVSFDSMNRARNLRLREMIWQARDRNTDWWLDIDE